MTHWGYDPTGDKRPEVSGPPWNIMLMQLSDKVAFDPEQVVALEEFFGKTIVYLEHGHRVTVELPYAEVLRILTRGPS